MAGSTDSITTCSQGRVSCQFKLFLVKFSRTAKRLFWSVSECKNPWTRRLAACTQAVVILRNTSYIAIELNVLHLIWRRTKFNRIDVLKLFCLWLHFLESINSLSSRLRAFRTWNESRSLYQAINVSAYFPCLFRCCCCFHISNKRDILNCRVIAVRDIELRTCLSKNINLSRDF